MKIWLIVLILFSVSFGYGQANQTFRGTYANSATDTLRFDATGPYVGFFLSTLDSANIAIIIQYTSHGTTGLFSNAVGNWLTATAIAGDTLVALTSSAKGLSLRHGTTNRIPGATMIRVLLKALTANGVTTPSFEAGVTR